MKLIFSTKRGSPVGRIGWRLGLDRVAVGRIGQRLGQDEAPVGWIRWRLDG